MSLMTVLMLVSCLICLATLWMTVRNLARYRAYSAGAALETGPESEATALGAGSQGDQVGAARPVLVSVCIPARNEQANLGACVESLLKSTHANIEVLVYDDHSTDGTAAELTRLATLDPRVRGVMVEALPQGWNGKQFACDRLGRSARGEWVLFTDADVRFGPGAVGAALAAASATKADLVSTVPLQRTHSVGEAIVVPMIHFLLMAYLPMGRMRSTRSPLASAGCGQFLFARREAWEKSGGHATFKASMHDGVMLPRSMRRSGFATDLFDGTEVASVRMYRSFTQAWDGFAKNAYEGLGSLPLLMLLTVLHAAGHLMPWAVMLLALVGLRFEPSAVGLAAFAAILALTQRFMLALRFHQRFIGAALHPVGVAVMTAIQWRSWWLHRTGRRTWRGRASGSGLPTSQIESKPSKTETIAEM